MNKAQKFLSSIPEDSNAIINKLNDMVESGDVHLREGWSSGRTVWGFPDDNSAVVVEGSDISVVSINPEMVAELSRMTTRDDAGKHFTETSEYYDDLEVLGLINITRPIHQSGLVYDAQYWSVELTDEGRDILDEYPELWAE